LPQTAANDDALDDVGLSFESPDSDTIVRADYDPHTQTMRVTFRRNAGTSRYEFSAIPTQLWREFAQADSKGGYFVRVIRPTFVGRKLS
jgi:hypothetical protein